MTYTSTITSKGTITLPAPIRSQLKLSPGRKVTIDVRGGSVVIHAPLDIESIREQNRVFMQKRGLKPVTDAQIDEAMARAANEKYKTGIGLK